ncbi:beta strand repeat-containing protein [Sphingomonas carotinifaciens]|uniref:Hemolysin-type calcium-binding repeat-containing protein n=1 Tax=Sphingomonas carotinifaciens TaxID=1166323 RepID=A0A1G7G4U3_9SPHN|nr:calcium-binding protein [Sphingomonas carotinifaciens]MBB4086383.1 Ca2+-binding RTX toxin-like protein [Sphingomonas carotinifaciens]MWC42703.1 hypothetical protein [Sphingomonas carotinifaciens]SDE83152.1 Hemolysin-type calcium-binding repeat-containing protein [Sphingomonas carotinifaciens]
MPVLYISPTGSGSGNGSSAADAATLADLPKLIAAAGPGGEVRLIADQGAYTAPADALSIVAGGREGLPVTIRGVDSAGNPMDATITGSRPAPFDPANPSGEEVMRLLDGADHLVFRDLAFDNVGTAFRVGADIADLTVQGIAATNVARFFDDIASGANTSATIDTLTIRDVDIAGYSKGAIRVQYDSSNILIQDVRADSGFQDGDNFAIGLHLDGTAHDVTVERVAMRNALDTVNDYRNGDGFATERGTYNISLRDIIATGNSDGGLDLKTDNIVVDGAIVSGNGRNIRLWGTNAQLSDIVSLDAGAPTPGGNREHVWLGANASASIDGALIGDPGSPTVFNLAERGGRLTVIDAGLSTGPGSTLVKRGTGATLTQTDSRAPAATGTPAADLVTGTATADTLSTGDGDDMALGGAGDDRIDGGAGDDMLVGDAGDDVIEGGAGEDILVGGAGRDRLSYANSAAGVTIDLSHLSARGGDAYGDLYDGFEDVEGSAFADTLTGDAAANRLHGNAGDDRLSGGAGDDILAGGAGADLLDGGAGYDLAEYRDSAAAIAIDLAAGTATGGDAAGDTLLGIEAIAGSAFGDALLGGAGGDTLDGAGGDDLIDGRGGDDMLVGGAGADTLIGGDGLDTADYSDSFTGVAVDLSAGTGLGGDAEGDRLLGIERLVGSAFADTLTGDAGANWFVGGAGADSITGGDGIDTVNYSSDAAVAVDLATGTGGDGDTLAGIENVIGTTGTDMLAGDAFDNALFGGAGDDRLAGRGGADRLDGGAGRDTADYSDSATGMTVDLRTGTASDGDTLIGIEDLIGSAHDDAFYGDAGANTLTGGAGADLLDGGDGFDTADYGTAATAVQIDLALDTQGGGDAQGDRLVGIEAVRGSVFADTLAGGLGADALHGGDGDDLIDGRDGDDLLDGGAGADTLTGGAGFDTVDYSRNAVAIAIDLATGTSTGGEAAGDRFSGIERFIGTQFADTLTGDANDQWFTGGAGADLLNGGAGFDTADYSASAAAVRINLATNVHTGGDAAGDSLTGMEAVIGSALADTLVGDAGANRLEGGAGNDTLDGGAGADVMIGGTGNDAYVVDTPEDQVMEAEGGGTDIVRTTLNALTLADHVEDLSYTAWGSFTGIGNALDNAIYGSTGDDALYGLDGDDKLVGGLGADLLVGGGGRDQADYTKSSAITVNLQTNVNTGGEAEGDRLFGIETVVGSNYADTITGNDDPLVADTLYGRGGNDTLVGGAGDDLLDGGAGNDIMTGGAGNDQYVVYEAGDQVIELAGGGTDRVRTAAATYLLPDHVEELVYTGTVAATLTGNAENNLIVGRTGGDTLSGGAGNDILRGAAGADLLDGGTGLDTADYTGSLGAVTINLRYATASGGDAEGDRLVSIENATGGAQSDVLNGSAAANILSGAAGNDTLFGDDGNDTLYGGDGQDRLDGGKNEDALYGDAGDDWLMGGQQADRLYGGAGNDRLIGDTDWISSLAAKDVLDGGDGDDWLVGDGTAFTASGRGADDRLTGGAGNDVLIGDGETFATGAIGGGDTLDGGAGDDILYGDAVTMAAGSRGGADTLTGGTGADRFVFAGSFGRDTITDFTRSDGDVIDLSGHGLSFDTLNYTVSSAGLTISLSDTDTIFLRGVSTLTQGDLFFG